MGGIRWLVIRLTDRRAKLVDQKVNWKKLKLNTRTEILNIVDFIVELIQEIKM